MLKQYPAEVRLRAVRLVLEHRGEYETEYAAIRSICAKCNDGTDTASSRPKRMRMASSLWMIWSVVMAASTYAYDVVLAENVIHPAQGRYQAS